jgi:hypothetical protein
VILSLAPEEEIELDLLEIVEELEDDQAQNHRIT